MAQLDDIIDAAVDEKVPIGTLLRKCLVLEQQVKNKKFRAWLDRELDGYDQMEELPPYRVINCENKGLFIGTTVRSEEIPGSVLVGLLEQIRTRVLRFALELKDNLPPDAADPKQVSAAVVERSVVNIIYGGNILIASHAENVSQMAHTTIAVGDIEGLKRALSTLGVTDEGLKKLEADIKADKTNGKPSIGPRIKAWLANIGQYLGKEGAKAGIDVTKKLATKWILQHYGMDLG
jgi:hypothetical protein